MSLFFHNYDIPFQSCPPPTRYTHLLHTLSSINIFPAHSLLPHISHPTRTLPHVPSPLSCLQGFAHLRRQKQEARRQESSKANNGGRNQLASCPSTPFSRFPSPPCLMIHESRLRLQEREGKGRGVEGWERGMDVQGWKGEENGAK